MTKIQQTAELGQSIWIDYIRRSFITSGELEAMIEEGLLGITSNPTIFDKAISGSSDYDEDISELVAEGKSVEQIYEALVLEDIGRAADILRPVYDAAGGRDGFVSLEVNPALANNAAATVNEARRLFGALNRPNVMIKVPATEEGLQAIPELIGSGVNVNVTLIFGIGNYKKVAEAYLQGLEKLAAEGPSHPAGLPLERVASVASFFVSRVDTATDRELAKKGNDDLQGKIAIANSKIAYAEFQEIFRGKRWEALAAKGAGKQRVLFGSTSTKNPNYPATMYVDELIGPETVNTIPPATYNAFKEKGTVALTLTENLEQARSRISRLAELGIDLDAITAQLQSDGVRLFAESFESLMESIVQKRDVLREGKKEHRAHLPELEDSVNSTLGKIRRDKIVKRVWEHDHTVWKPEPDEITNRLGWLKIPEVMAGKIAELEELAAAVRADGYRNALLLGMGGSSLAPEVFREIYGVQKGFLDLHVLDSTDPGVVLDYARKLDPAETLYVVSTKSGSTVETLSFMKYFYNQALHKLGADAVGAHFIAVTDPGSGLVDIAGDLNFRKTFLNDPNIGGRYSALSYFGLVPAALVGVELHTLLDRASTMIRNCEWFNTPTDGDNSGAWLGAIVGELAAQGRDKLTFILTPRIAHFGAWVEQLIAESTGKEGKGILPVAGEELLKPEQYSRDRLFVYLRLDNDTHSDAEIEALRMAGFPVVELRLRDLYDVGEEYFRWEFATAIAGWRIGINPFNQPNVESAKKQARKMVDSYKKEGKLPETEAVLEQKGIRLFAGFEADNLQDALEKFLAQANSGRDDFARRSYIAIQAYVKPSPEVDAALHEFRTRLQKKYRMATTVGYGPRFLHSTGQLHKGDAGNGLFIQMTAEMPQDTDVPDQAGSDESSISFGVLKTAQCLGDRQALEDAGRRVIRFDLGENISRDIRKLADTIG